MRGKRHGTSQIDPMKPSFTLHHGDVIEQLRRLPSESVHSCITSPPYWGLRDYGITPSVWGGSRDCRHEWGLQERGRRSDVLPSEESKAQRLGTRNEQSGQNDGGRFCSLCGAWRGCLGLEPDPDLFVAHIVEVFLHVRRVLHKSGTLWINFGDCYITNGGHSDTGVHNRRGEIGAGAVPEHEMRHFRARPRQNLDCDPKRGPSARDGALYRHTFGNGVLKSKDLAMIPFRVALALQAEGWYLRSVIPWLKRNGMPESTIDRPTSMVEYVFLLSKQESYFYDREAVRLSSSRNGSGNLSRITSGRNRKDDHLGSSIPWHGTSRARRNTDWFFESSQGLLSDAAGDPLALLVNPQPFAIEMCKQCDTIYAQRDYRKLEQVCLQCAAIVGPKDRECGCGANELRRLCICNASDWLSHFATFPERLVEPMILAGTSAEGVCSECGAPWERIVEKPKLGDWHTDPSHKHDRGARNSTAKWAKGDPQAASARMNGNVAGARAVRNGDPPHGNFQASSQLHNQPFPSPQTIGWAATCECGAKPVPATVLDPFAGSGRTGLAAYRLGRKFIGVDAKREYVALAHWQQKRLADEATA